MTWVVPLDASAAFALAMIRLLGVFLFAPFFGHAAVPMRVRVGLAFLVAWMGAAHWAVVPPPAEMGPIALAVLQEAVIGVSLGLATSLVFAGFALMTEFASIQGGLGAAAAIDPASGANSVVLTQLVQWFALTVFLAVGGHHLVLKAVLTSFEHLPLGAGLPSAETFAGLASLGSGIFELALRLAAPFTAVMLLSNLAVGMLGRAIPQLNLMALQRPAHIGITLLILALGAGPLVAALGDATVAWIDAVTLTLLGGH